VNNDPPNTYVVKIADLDKKPLLDTKGRPVEGKIKKILHGNAVAIVKTEPLA